MLDLISYFACLLPMMVCMLTAVMLLLRRQKTYSQRVLAVWYMLLTAGFYAGTYTLSPSPDYALLAAWSPLLCTVLLTWPVVMAEVLVGKLLEQWRGRLRMLLALPVVAATIAAVCLYLEGSASIGEVIRLHTEGASAAGRLYALIVMELVPVVAAVLTVALIVIYATCIIRSGERPLRSFFRGEPTDPVYLMSAALLPVIGLEAMRAFLWDALFVGHPAAGPIYSLVLVPLLYIGSLMTLVLDKRSVTLSELQHLQSTASMRPLPASIEAAQKQDEATRELCTRIRLEVEENRRFADPDYNIADLAKALDVNRVYVSQAINRGMHANFRDWMTRLRINDFKQQALAHPDWRQERLAKECGFADATALSRKFKEVEGQTPSAWLKVNRVQ